MCSYYKREFFLHEYQGDIVFSDNPSPRDYGGSTSVADIDVRVEYLDYTITLYPAMKEYWDKGQYWRIAEVLCHEFCHVLTDPLYFPLHDATPPKEREWIRVIRERQTQRICNIIFSMIPKKVWMPKKKGGKKV